MKTAFALAILLLPTCLMAESVRCGSEIISKGSNIAMVAAKCGEPAHIDKSSIYSGSAGAVNGVPGVVSGTAVQIEVETWTYNFGSSQLMERIRFENGIVVQIDSMGYGYD